MLIGLYGTKNRIEANRKDFGQHSRREQLSAKNSGGALNEEGHKFFETRCNWMQSVSTRIARHESPLKSSFVETKISDIPIPFPQAPALLLEPVNGNNSDAISSLLPVSMDGCGVLLEHSSDNISLAKTLATRNKTEVLPAKWEGDFLPNSSLSGNLVSGIGKAIAPRCGADLMHKAAKRVLPGHAEFQKHFHISHNLRLYTSCLGIGTAFSGGISTVARHAGEATKKVIDWHGAEHQASNSSRGDVCEIFNRIHGTGECLNGGYKRKEYVK